MSLSRFSLLAYRLSLTRTSPPTFASHSVTSPTHRTLDLVPLTSRIAVSQPTSRKSQVSPAMTIWIQQGTSDNFKGPTRVLDNSLPSSLKFTSFIHSTGQNDFDSRTNNEPGQVDPERNPRPIDSPNRPPISTGRNTAFFEDFTKRLTEADRTRTAPTEPTRPPFTRPESGSMNYIRGIMRDNISDMIGSPNPSQNYRFGVEQNADIVHIKIMRNNTFVTLTDSKGNKKTGASAGCLAEMKGGPKVSKYSAEATAEHIGRVARSMGVKNVVIKVNGFTFFKRKKLAMLSFRDGYTHSRPDRNPIVYIEDTTRKAHNGCRLKKQRRV